ncbi:uncharacterized protein [Sinocyclocheilus grahami]|uniref:uncharacterized protein isoform X2 n=1 Tax=Sinocyclocheilus grahami TaxID=75366 RepID=UPI0007AC9577|nr:PREDICTED: uncharacterized protein LOC107598576 isoform X2 [Sinocyclocheilus grahami]
MMGTPVKNEPSAAGCMALCGDLTSTGDSTARASSQQGEQTEAPTPVLLYPISVNSALSSSPIFNNRDNKVPHGGRGIEAVSTSSEFTHGAIVHLIEAMQRCWDVYSSRERSLLFQSVQKELESHGHSLPVEKIRRKWNNLIVTYKRVKDRSSLCGGQTKTSWEYFEMMDNILGKTKFAQRGPASATLVGFATTAKAGVRSEDHASNSMPVAAMAASCLLPTGIITTSSQIPTLVTSPVLCKVTPKLNPSPSCSTDTPLPALSPKPVPLVNRQPLKRRLRHLRLNSMASRVAQQQGQAEERTALLRSFLTAQEERIRLDEQHQSKADACERRKEKSARAMADAMGRMATALELISSKQDTIIALLQRLADKH